MMIKTLNIRRKDLESDREYEMKKKISMNNEATTTSTSFRDYNLYFIFVVAIKAMKKTPSNTNNKSKIVVILKKERE